MYCSNCGNKIEKHEKFCTNCGNEIKIEQDINDSNKGLEYIIKENIEKQENDIFSETINENLKNQKHKNRSIKRTLNIVVFIIVFIIIYILIANMKQNNVEPKDVNNNVQKEIEKITLNVENNLRQDIDIEINKENFLKYIVEDLNTICNEYLTEDTNVELFSSAGLYNVNKNEISFIIYIVFYTNSDNKDCIIAVQKVKETDDILLPVIAMIDNISYPLVSNEIIQTTMSFMEVMGNYTFNSDHVMFSIAPKANSDIYELIVDDVDIDIILTENIDNSEQNIAIQDILNNQNSNDNEEVTANEDYEEMMNLYNKNNSNNKSDNNSSINNDEKDNSNINSEVITDNNSVEKPEEYLEPLISIRDSHDTTYNQDGGYITIDINDYDYDDEVTVLVNGNQATRVYRTCYSYDYNLTVGENSFDISVTNKYGKTTNKKHTIKFEPSVPKISIMQQGNSYGFIDEPTIVADYNKLKNLDIKVTCNGKPGTITYNEYYNVSEQEEEGENTVVFTVTNKYGKTYTTNYTYTK